MIDISEILREDATIIEAELDKRLDRDVLGGGEMAEAMRYATLGGGKRIRAFLTLEFCKMFGGKKEDAKALACAIEMVHAYSLIHDDLPCMDNSDMRRGKPSCHKKYGEYIALLAGDSLLTYAFTTAVLDYDERDRMNRYVIYELSHGAGAAGMCGGQELDLQLECKDYDELCHLHNLKTGALIRTASLLGYYRAVPKPDPETVEKITAYSMAIGLAFQIVDDLLDVRSTPEELGKPVGGDEKNGKKTSLTFMTEEEAEKKAEELTEYAEKIFEGVEGAEIINALPAYLLKRKN